jgi:hypothetical protein
MLDNNNSPTGEARKVLAVWNAEWKDFYANHVVYLGLLPCNIANHLLFEAVRKNDAGFALEFADVPKLNLDQLSVVVPAQGYGEYFVSGRRTLTRRESDSMRLAESNPDLKVIGALLTGLLGSDAHIRQVACASLGVYSGMDEKTSTYFSFRLNLAGDEPSYSFVAMCKEEVQIRLSEPTPEDDSSQNSFAAASTLFYNLVAEFKELRKARNYFQTAKKRHAVRDVNSQRIVQSLEIEDSVWKDMNVIYSETPDSRPILFAFSRDLSLSEKFVNLTFEETFHILWDLFVSRDFEAVPMGVQGELINREEDFISAKLRIAGNVFVSMSLEQLENSNYRAEVTFALLCK